MDEPGVVRVHTKHQHAAREQRTTRTWGHVVGRLIANGHRWERIRFYSLRQVETFYLETQQIEREQQIGQMLAARSAWLKAEDFTAAIDKLSRHE